MNRVWKDERRVVNIHVVVAENVLLVSEHIQ